MTYRYHAYLQISKMANYLIFLIIISHEIKQVLKFCNRFLYIVLESLSNETIKIFVAVSLSGCFPSDEIFRALSNFSLFVSSQAELIEKRQRNIALRAENSA